jgi:hypothetical protein
MRRKAEAGAQEIVRDAQDERRRMLARPMPRRPRPSRAARSSGRRSRSWGRRCRRTPGGSSTTSAAPHTHLRAPIAQAEATIADDGRAFDEPIDEFRLPRFVRRT